jgi:23S rRNA pseudouridine2605 synthase
VSIAGRPVAVRRVLLLRTEPQGAVFDVVVHEGRNRIIRRMFERVGYPVLALKRTRIGPLELGALPVGAWRDLTPDEVAALARVVDLDRQIVRDEPRRFNARPRQAEMARGRSDGAKRSTKGAATVPDRYRNRRSSRSGEKHRPR